MSSTAAQALDAWLEQRVAADDFPGWSCVVADATTLRHASWGGDAVRDPERIAVGSDTLYDLASLTKPLVTGLLVLLDEQRQPGLLQSPASRWLPELRPSRWQPVTVEELLRHSAGLPAWAPLYCGRDRLVSRIASLPAAHSRNQRALYSDIGYLLLGELLQRRSGLRLDELFTQLLSARLGLSDELLFCPSASLRARVAASERGNVYEQGMTTVAVPERGLIWGEVHDGNAHALGGVAGHAGLFGSASAVARLAQQLLRPDGLLAAELLARVFEPEPVPGEPRRSLLFELSESETGGGGDGLSPRAVGHTGFTGTSLFVDPGCMGVFVLLSNRVHPSWRELPMNQRRRQFHQLARRVLEGGA